MKFHCPRRTGFYTEATGYTAVVIEIHLICLCIENKSAGGADGDTGTAVSAAFLVAQNAVAQRFYFDTGRGDVFNTLVVISLFAADFQHYITFLVWDDGGFQNVKTEIVIFNEVIYKRLLDNSGREMQNNFSRYFHGVTFSSVRSMF
jgi:hypothetical protein